MKATFAGISWECKGLNVLTAFCSLWWRQIQRRKRLAWTNQRWWDTGALEYIDHNCSAWLASKLRCVCVCMFASACLHVRLKCRLLWRKTRNTEKLFFTVKNAEWQRDEWGKRRETQVENLSVSEVRQMGRISKTRHSQWTEKSTCFVSSLSRIFTCYFIA